MVFLEGLGTLGGGTPLTQYVTGRNVFTGYFWLTLCSSELPGGFKVGSHQVLGLSCCLIVGQERVESDMD